LISESAPEGKLGEAFGIHRAMDTAGAFVGVLVALGLLSLFPTNYRLIFILAIIPGIISMWITRSIREVPRVSAPKRWSMAEVKALPFGYWHALVISSLFALANTSDMFLLRSAKDSGYSDLQTVLMYALYNIVYASLAFPTGKLSDRVGRKPVIAFGWLIYGLVYLGFAYMTKSAVWLLFAGYGIYQGCADGASKALVADYSPKEHKGAAMGFFYMCAGFGTLAGNLAGGLLWDKIGPEAMFKVDAALSIISAVGLLTLRKKAVQK
jgi:MFS family permease